MIDYSDRLQIAVGHRYRIERELGTGGMATVYLAEDLKHNRKVAIKVLQPELAASVGSDRFLREIQISAKLQHPHILMLIDSGQVADSLYYVMPYVDGESLRERLEREGTLSPAEAARTLRDIVDALAYAHGQGVVHRDIKPDNVLLTERHALVTDFGVAKAVSEAAGPDRSAAAGMALGTPAYMAPEQVVAHEEIDHRADIYAVGALGYELLSGRPPFEGSNPKQVFAAHVRATPEPLSKRVGAVPAELDALLMRCLAKRPGDRWQRAEQMLGTLEAIAAPEVAVRPRPRRTVAWSLSAAAAAIAVVLLAVSLRPAADLDPRRVVVVPFTNVSQNPDYDAFGRVAASWVAEGLQQADLVRVVPIQAVEAEIESGGERGTRELAELMEAGTAVSGSYHVRGDSIHFVTEIADVRSAELLAATPEASALLTDPMEAVEQLRRQVLAALVNHFDPWVGEFVDEARQPPLFSAFRSYLAGMERFTRHDDERALPHFYRAAQLDSTFRSPAIAAAAAHLNLGEYATADSLVSSVNRSRSQLFPLDRSFLAFVDGRLRGDYAAAHSAARDALLISPGGGWWEYQAAWTALAANLPEAALEHLARVDLTHASVRGWPEIWTTMAAAHHVLGDHRAELQAAARGREQYPERLTVLASEVSARAALGRAEEVMSLLDGARGLPAEPGFGYWDLLVVAALEFRAHGHAEAYRAAIQRALNWLDSRPDQEKSGPEHSYRLARSLYWGEQWERAWRLFTDLGSESPVPLARLGFLGVTQARLGGRAAAQRIYSLLAVTERPYSFGEDLLWRARIAAVMGRDTDAIELLGEALRNGQRFTIALHRDIDLELLREHPAYVALMRPRG